MVEPAQNRHGYDFAMSTVLFCLFLPWYPLSQPLMRPGHIEVGRGVLLDDAAQMLIVQDHDVRG